MEAWKLKTWDLVSALLFLVGALLFGVGCFRLGILWMAAGGIVVFSSIVLALCKLRCPFCRRFLGLLSAGKMSFCPHCGAPLEEKSRDI